MPAFAALADDTRREIVEVLAEGDRSVTELVERFTISQPAISRHLKLLREAGLVRAQPVGKQRIYQLEVSGLRDMTAWAARCQQAWERRFDALGDHLDDLSRSRKEKQS